MPAHAPAAAADFKGFPPGGFEFFLELQARQSREWFKSRKAQYEELWPRPLEALLADLSRRLSDVFPGMAEARPHIFRIQRDTRFSADKSPYKTHVAAHVPIHPLEAGEWRCTPSVYLHFGLEESLAALGKWEVDRELLPPLRERMADERFGSELQRRLDEARKAGFELSAYEALRRVPAPYPRDHPRAELLKRKGLSVSLPDLPEDLLPSPALVDWLAERLRRAAPVAVWIEEALLAGVRETS